MLGDTARQRYRQRYIEPGLPACPTGSARWRHVLVIPAYRESADLLQRLVALPSGAGRSLVILVLNRPDTDHDRDANTELRAAAADLAVVHMPAGTAVIKTLNDHADLLVHDLDQLVGPVPATRGVGLARKTGCDLAFHWIEGGAIDSEWLCCSDADAELPADYFTRLDAAGAAAAAVYPFRHVPGEDPTSYQATLLYELRLHHYVLGLDYAGSPYAGHTLGSCIAVTADSYARVRGFPRRAGAEDFYLLNKVAKLGPVSRLAGDCIRLRSRVSTRVPFGTGPAVARLRQAMVVAVATAGNPPAGGPAQFYHPASFEALRCFLAAVPALRRVPVEQLSAHLDQQLHRQGLAPALAGACGRIVQALGLAGAVAHCQRQGRSAEQFMRQFHHWFDALRTLKLIHGLRDAGWPLQDLQDLQLLQPQLWPPADTVANITPLLDGVRRQWGWTG